MIQESTYVFESPNLMARMSASINSMQTNKTAFGSTAVGSRREGNCSLEVTYGVKTEIQIHKNTRGCSFLMSADAKVLAFKKNSSEEIASSSNPDSRVSTTRKIEKKMVKTGSSLLDEMIFEILSWLPVESLLRFKCICKMWCSTIEDPKFIAMHTSRAPYITRVFKREYPEVTSLHSYKGLMLDKNVLTNVYRLRNLATKQILDLPGPREQTGTCANVCYTPATNDLKIIYMHYSEEARNGCRLVYDVLRVGSDHTWKRLESPSLCKRRKLWPASLSIGTVLYCLKKGLMGERLMECLDLENDQIVTTINMPRNFFSKGEKILRMYWKGGKPCVGSIEQGKLIVWVLENHRKHQWARSKITIPLKFMEDYPRMSNRNIMPHDIVGNQITWAFKDDGYAEIFSFDMESDEVKFIASVTGKLLLCQTLLHVKGMRSEPKF